MCRELIKRRSHEKEGGEGRIEMTKDSEEEQWPTRETKARLKDG